MVILMALSERAGVAGDFAQRPALGVVGVEAACVDPDRVLRGSTPSACCLSGNWLA